MFIKKNDPEIIIFMPSIESGGVEKNLFLICNFLAQKKKKITLITASNNFKSKFEKKIKYISLENLYWSSRGRFIKYFICIFFLVKEILNKKNAIVFSFQGNIFSIIISKLFNRKIIIRANSDPEGWQGGYWKNFIFKNILKYADLIIVNSYQFKKNMELKYNIKAKTIYNPLNKKNVLRLSKQKINFTFFKKNSLNIISIGRLVDQKDHITILKSLNLLKNTINFRFLLLGSGVNRNKLDEYIYKNNLQKIVKIIQYKKNPYPYLAKSNLFILASKFEGLPNVLLEALVLKKYILSTKCKSGPAEIIKNKNIGIFFKIGDFKDLSKKIKNYYWNNIKNKFSDKKFNIDKYIIKFNFKANMYKYLNTINSLK